VRYFAIGAAVCLLGPAEALAQGRAVVLRQADVRIVMNSPTACDVTAALTLEVDRPTDLMHRLQIFEGARAELLNIDGRARTTTGLRPEGRTMIFGLRLDAAGQHTYSIRYRVTQPDAWEYRCPVWLPSAATDGGLGVVRLQADVPAGAAPAGGSFPALSWQAGHGTATIGHLPAFVRVPFFAPGHSPGWIDRQDLATVTDVTAVVLLAAGSLVWVWRRRR
jgi:hypothetical protein